MTDFSTSEGKQLYQDKVKQLQELLLIDRTHAEMLAAVIMWEGPKETIPSQDAPS